MGLCNSNALSHSTLKKTSTLSDLVVKRLENPKDLYENLGILGSGSYSSVYLVKDKSTGAFKALKEISKASLRQNASESIRNEILILSQLVFPNQNHPNIIKIFEVIDSHSFFYIVSEHLEGGELFHKIINERIPEITASKYAFDILSGINYCHKKKIVHKDLKPENIIFESKSFESKLKIIDFGTSEIMALSECKFQTAIGTVFEK